MRNTIDGFYFLIWKTAGLLARDRMRADPQMRSSLSFRGLENRHCLLNSAALSVPVEFLPEKPLITQNAVSDGAASPVRALLQFVGSLLFATWAET